MVFGFIKKAVKGIGKGIGKGAGAGVKLVKKLPQPLINLAYDAVFAIVMKRLKGKTVKYLFYIIIVLKQIITKTLFPRGASMNPFERAIREIVDVVDAAITKNGNVVVELIEAVMSLGSVYKEIDDLSPEQRIPMLREALDNLIGNEPGAVIGPNGKIKFSIPFVGLETVSDLIINGAMEVLKAKYRTTP